MPGVPLTSELREEYEHLFTTCQVRPAHAAAIDQMAAAIKTHRGRYDAVAAQVNVPWYAIALIHAMEASLRFDRHLHNGDPLTARTVQVPAGRPPSGAPPFTWVTSAVDALTFEGFPKWADWSLPGLLYKLEGYNGWGYREHHPTVRTPYLWSFSNHYTKGKYVKDGKWSATAVSEQCGAAVLLRRLVEQGVVQMPTSTSPPVPLLRYSPNERLPHGEALQTFLNTFPGIALTVDGKPGKLSSDAFKAVTGHYLHGDPRNKPG
jgi:lysozyme family protein